MKCDFCGKECSRPHFIDCTDDWILRATAGRINPNRCRESMYFGAPMKEVVICEMCTWKIEEGKTA